MRQRIAIGVLLLALSLGVSAGSSEIVVVVAADCPVERLSRTQLADIYLGRINRFPNGARVLPIDQTERSPAHDRFYQRYLDRSPAQINAHWSRQVFTGRGRPPHAVPNGAAVADSVADNPNAIGYLAREHVDARLRVLRLGP
jgi:ABC-type phosphate transport system substrate-binding protein